MYTLIIVLLSIVGCWIATGVLATIASLVVAMQSMALPLVLSTWKGRSHRSPRRVSRKDWKKSRRVRPAGIVVLRAKRPSTIVPQVVSSPVSISHIIKPVKVRKPYRWINDHSMDRVDIKIQRPIRVDGFKLVQWTAPKQQISSWHRATGVAIKRSSTRLDRIAGRTYPGQKPSAAQVLSSASRELRLARQSDLEAWIAEEAQA